MKRREFITLIGGAAAIAWPRAARAQQPDRIRRIGVMTNFTKSDPETQVWIEAFRKRLQELGWRENENIRIEERWAASDAERRRIFAAELVSLNPDVIFAVSTPSIAALQRLTRTTPIVFANANDPIGSGFVTNLARPGGNITGFVSHEPANGGKWLEILREIAPSVTHVGVLHNPQTHTGQYFSSIEIASRVMGIRSTRLPYRNGAEIEKVMAEFGRGPNDGLLIPPDSSNIVHGDTIVSLAERYRLPAVYYHRLFTTRGGLASYGTDYSQAYRKAAEYVDRILKGAKPAELPVQAPTKFELVISLKAAKAISLNVSPNMLARADEVIE